MYISTILCEHGIIIKNTSHFGTVLLRVGNKKEHNYMLATKKFGHSDRFEQVTWIGMHAMNCSTTGAKINA